MVIQRFAMAVLKTSWQLDQMEMQCTAKCGLCRSMHTIKVFAGRDAIGRQKESETRCDHMQVILNCLRYPEHSGGGLGFLSLLPL